MPISVWVENQVLDILYGKRKCFAGTGRGFVYE